MPMAAMHHQGLLQAMLALSSLHIAKLTGASTTPSIKHYAYALKRTHSSLDHPVKRHSVPVIAASSLLGLYELWCADHVKWNSHLAGARQLVVETDYTGMSKQLRRLKMEHTARQQQQSSFQYQPGDFPMTSGWSAQDALLDQVYDIDSHVVSMLAGQSVNYEEHGHVIKEHEVNEPPQELDIPRFEILKDLFWLYCKQDVYQSLISGNPLL